MDKYILRILRLFLLIFIVFIYNVLVIKKAFSAEPDKHFRPINIQAVDTLLDG